MSFQFEALANCRFVLTVFLTITSAMLYADMLPPLKNVEIIPEASLSSSGKSTLEKGRKNLELSIEKSEHNLKTIDGNLEEIKKETEELAVLQQKHESLIQKYQNLIQETDETIMKYTSLIQTANQTLQTLLKRKTESAEEKNAIQNVKMKITEGTEWHANATKTLLNLKEQKKLIENDLRLIYKKDASLQDEKRKWENRKQEAQAYTNQLQQIKTAEEKMSKGS